MKQFLIAIDQLVNTCVYAKYEGFGFADETLSARMYRLSGNPKWAYWRDVVDFVFGPNHCLYAFQAECERQQLPTGYCNEPD